MPEAATEHAAAPPDGEPPRPAGRSQDAQTGHPARHNGGMRLARIAWLMTTLGCLVAALVAVADGYRGYAAVAFAVAVSAAINLL